MRSSVPRVCSTRMQRRNVSRPSLVSLLQPICTPRQRLPTTTCLVSRLDVMTTTTFPLVVVEAEVDAAAEIVAAETAELHAVAGVDARVES